MPPILYRGKRQDNDEWLVESAIMYDDELCTRIAILDAATGEFEEVQSLTVSQFTGLYDCNGKRIFENDVVRIKSMTGVIKYHPYMTCFYIDVDGIKPTINNSYATLGDMWKSYRKDITVLGDVFQPEFSDNKWKEL